MDKATAGMSLSKINTATRIGDDMTTGIIAVSIVYCVFVWLILPRLTDEERRFEDEEFVRQYRQRKGDV